MDRHQALLCFRRVVETGSVGAAARCRMCLCMTTPGTDCKTILG